MYSLHSLGFFEVLSQSVGIEVGVLLQLGFAENGVELVDPFLSFFLLFSISLRFHSF